MIIWGGVPSIILEDSACSDEEFEAYMMDLFRIIAPGDAFILGVADNVTGPSKLERIIRIGEMVDLVCMSTLLTTTMPMMGKIMQAMQDAGMRERVKAMVGGAPVSQSYALSIGADGFAPDAASAVEQAKGLLEVKTS